MSRPDIVDIDLAAIDLSDLDRFASRRTPNPYLTFGYRSHYCTGANLARLEIRVILDELLDRVEGFELCGPVERVRTNKYAGVWQMPMTFGPRQDA